MGGDAVADLVEAIVDFHIGVCIFPYPTLTLNRYPTSAVNPIAIVPQNVILIIALLILEPPVLAANAPKMIRKNRANP